MKKDLPKAQLERMIGTTDDNGIFQHSIESEPDPRHGYSIDDQARALIVCARTAGEFDDGGARWRYLEFIDRASRSDGSFLNFMDSEGNWVRGQVISQDCHGRAMWGLAEFMFSDGDPDEKRKAEKIFWKGFNGVENIRYPHSLAFNLLGLSHFLNHRPGDSEVKRAAERMASKLHNAFLESSDGSWYWFCDKMTYCNARLPHAMIEAGKVLDRVDFKLAGSLSIDFLSEKSFGEGRFNPVGNHGWYQKGGEMVKFDQQTIEAGSMVEALVAAYSCGRNESDIEKARLAFEWFRGQNAQDCSLLTAEGGVYDGLMENGPNINQGAESVLSYLMAHTALAK